MKRRTAPSRADRLARGTRRGVGVIVLGTLLLSAALMLFAWMRAQSEDLPWTPLDLSRPIGAATGRKLAALTGDAPKCRALLTRAGVRFDRLEPVQAGQCGYADGVRFASGGTRKIGFAPAGVGVSCPVAAALTVWEWDVVQTAALTRFGARVVQIQHFGSYNCRRMYGRSFGAWSEHSTADAIDVAGFRLSDGTRISVARDWNGTGRKARFLRDVRNGACRLFSTTLSPDYNAAHRDHLHLDQAERGAWGWRICR